MRMSTYRPLRIGLNLDRMVLKSSRSSANSRQHSFITTQTQSMQFSSKADIGGLNNETAKKYPEIGRKRKIVYLPESFLPQSKQGGYTINVYHTGMVAPVVHCIRSLVAECLSG